MKIKTRITITILALISLGAITAFVYAAPGERTEKRDSRGRWVKLENGENKGRVEVWSLKEPSEQMKKDLAETATENSRTRVEDIYRHEIRKEIDRINRATAIENLKASGKLPADYVDVR